MKDINEKNIERLAKKENPFKVPDGYFEEFSARMSDVLPQQDYKHIPPRATSSRHQMWQYLVGAAATVCFAILGLTVYLSNVDKQQSSLSIASTSEINAPVNTTDSYEDEYVDYAMMDNMDIYAYISEE